MSASPAPTSMPTAASTRRTAITKRSVPPCRPAARWSISITEPAHSWASSSCCLSPPAWILRSPAFGRRRSAGTAPIPFAPSSERPEPMAITSETEILARQDQPTGNWVTNSRGYQTLLVFLLSLNFGIVFFDRQALNALMPFVQPELALSGTQIGLLAAGLSFSWAIAAFFVGALSDSLGKRKLLLVIATLAFSLCSFLSGLATSFLFLFAARLLMGAAEGGVMPISHAMVASEVNPERRGLAQGVAQNLGSNLLGSFAAPVVLVAFAQMFSWREAFYLAAVPGLVSAALIWFLLEEPQPATKEKKPRAGFARAVADYGGEVRRAMAIRNMWISVAVGILMVAHFVITWAFMPVFLVQSRGMDATSM